MRATAYRRAQSALNSIQTQIAGQARTYVQSPVAAAPPRHLLSVSDLTAGEFAALVRNAASYKAAMKAGKAPAELTSSMAGKTVAMMFSKRSTRTRVSTEAAVTMLGGHPMFLGKDDIQLGVNESLYDTSKVISSMTSCMVARVGQHQDVADLAASSSVPVINALSDDFHPLQAIADLLTIHQEFAYSESTYSSSASGLGLRGLKLGWIGDSNNVLFDLATACMMMGVDVTVASPKGFEIPDRMRTLITNAGEGVEGRGKLYETNVPEEAVKDADILVTDTWVSMGQESDRQKRLDAFKGFQITEELAKRGGAKEGWKFMHCLPRHSEEVSDEVFYSDRSLVFSEAENRLWAAVAALEGFVVNNGDFVCDLHRGDTDM